MNLEEKITKIIEKQLQEKEIFVDKVEYIKEDNNNFLRITIDCKNGVDIDTCVEASKIINPILDEEDIIKDSYILDVTSKGVDDN